MSSPWIPITIVRTKNRLRDIYVWVMPFEEAQAFRDTPGPIPGALQINVDFAEEDDLVDWLMNVAVPFETKFLVREKYVRSPDLLSKLRAQFHHAANKTMNKKN